MAGSRKLNIRIATKKSKDKKATSKKTVTVKIKKKPINKGKLTIKTTKKK